MTKHPVLISDDLGKSSESAGHRSKLVQKLGDDFSQLLQTTTDVVYVHPINETVGRRILTDQSQRKVHEELLKNYIKTMLAFKNPGDLHIKSGWPVERIVKLVNNEKKFEAVVMGTRALEGVERFFLGSVAEEVVRSVRRPLVILGPTAQKAEYELPKRKLNFLIVTDLTKRCRAVETYAISLAQKLDAHVTFYHSLAETMSSTRQYASLAGEAMSVFDSIFEDLKKDTVASMEKKIERLRKKGISCDSFIDTTEGTELVERVLSWSGGKEDMIFMGHQSQGFIASTVLGSNLRKMIAAAKVPVVVVPS